MWTRLNRQVSGITTDCSHSVVIQEDARFPLPVRFNQEIVLELGIALEVHVVLAQHLLHPAQHGFWHDPQTRQSCIVGTESCHGRHYVERLGRLECVEYQHGASVGVLYKVFHLGFRAILQDADTSMS
jgi:hypothetical protein